MTLEQIKAELLDMAANPTDAELQHARADVLLIEALKLLGGQEIAAAFEEAQEKAQFWYS